MVSSGLKKKKKKKKKINMAFDYEGVQQEGCCDSTATSFQPTKTLDQSLQNWLKRLKLSSVDDVLKLLDSNGIDSFDTLQHCDETDFISLIDSAQSQNKLKLGDKIKLKKAFLRLQNYKQNDAIVPQESQTSQNGDKNIIDNKKTEPNNAKIVITHNEELECLNKLESRIKKLESNWEQLLNQKSIIESHYLSVDEIIDTTFENLIKNIINERKYKLKSELEQYKSEELTTNKQFISFAESELESLKQIQTNCKQLIATPIEISKLHQRTQKIVSSTNEAYSDQKESELTQMRQYISNSADSTQTYYFDSTTSSMKQFIEYFANFGSITTQTQSKSTKLVCNDSDRSNINNNASPSLSKNWSDKRDEKSDFETIESASISKIINANAILSSASKKSVILVEKKFEYKYCANIEYINNFKGFKHVGNEGMAGGAFRTLFGTESIDSSNCDCYYAQIKIKDVGKKWMVSGSSIQIGLIPTSEMNNAAEKYSFVDVCAQSMAYSSSQGYF